MPSSNDPGIPHLQGENPGDPGNPSFLNRVDGADHLIVLTDFDGTIAEIREDPDAAAILPDARLALSRLAGRSPVRVGVVSGRALSDLRDRVGLENVWYVGNHGLEIDVGDRQFTHPEADATADRVRQVCARLCDRLGDIDGVVVEEKGVTATIHYRKVAKDSAVERIRETVLEAVNRHDDAIRATEGKEILELRPAVDWDKGAAVRWILDGNGSEFREPHTVYVGDDATDESVFRTVTGRATVDVPGTGTGVFVGERGRETAADFRVDDPGAVVRLLTWLAESRHAG